MLNCGILLCMEKKEAQRRIVSCAMDGIAQERARQGLTLSQLGQIAGVSGSSIGMMEKGKMSPRVVTCLLVADALGLSFGICSTAYPAALPSLYLCGLCSNNQYKWVVWKKLGSHRIYAILNAPNRENLCNQWHLLRNASHTSYPHIDALNVWLETRDRQSKIRDTASINRWHRLELLGCHLLL
jgi:DNA-binding XRE family transcriptional regulator